MENMPVKFDTPNKPTKLLIYCPCCGKDNGRVRFNFGLKRSIVMKCKSCQQEFAVGGIGFYNKALEPMILIFASNHNSEFFCLFDGTKNFEDVELVDRDYSEAAKKCKDCARVYQYRFFDPSNENDRAHWEQWKKDQAELN
ncbi:MAG: hypothetical protein KW802_01510 [Candidatus Doudnabacteria bacterium]|nr:hypothetical protein [Candidatus Doudnabacteria bacterium]